MTGSKVKTTVENDGQEYETISSPGRIASLLKPFENKTDLFVVKLANSDTTHQSTLLNVDTDKNILVFDRLTPSDGHKLLIKSRKATLQISYKGTEISFAATLNETNPEEIMPRYEFIFPKSIQYIHRRNTYRVTVRNNDNLSVELLTSKKERFQGDLHNISTEGMCIRFPKNICIPEDNDSAEIRCVITLTNDQELNCSFNICHAYVHEHSKDFRIGGNFQYLDKTQKRAIEKFVVELQRKAQKTMIR